jgi:hypothetical protein
MIPAMSCTAISSSRSGTDITVSAASCRSTYDTATGRPVAMLLRTGKTPSGAEAAGHIRRLVRHIRRHWPDTHITIRGDGHYGRPEVMAFCEAHRVDYVFGLPTNAALRADPAIVAAADACAVKRAQRQYPVLRNYAETRYGAKSWKCQRRVVARIEASTLGMDIRYVVTSLQEDRPSISTTRSTARAARPRT